jgi:hypothetical protein
VTDTTMARPNLEVTATSRLIELDDVAPQRLVTIEGRLGLFTPFEGEDPKASTDNLTEIVDVLRRRVEQLQETNAQLEAKLDATPPRSADDVAAAIAASVDTLQSRLGQMDNAVTNFGLREFSLQSKVRVDVTPLGTLGFHFVQPGDLLPPEALSTLSVTLVPVPKEPAPPGEAAAAQTTAGADLHQLGFSRPDVELLHAQHVDTAADLASIGTRASATATLSAMLGTDRQVLGDRIALGALTTLPSVDLARAGVLTAAGLGSTGLLAAAEPEAVVQQFAVAAAGSSSDQGWRPSVELAEQWVATAAALERRRSAG